MNYSKDEKVAIWLSTFEHLTEKKQYAILALFEKPEDLFVQFDSKLSKIEEIVGNTIFSKMKLTLSNEFLSSYLKQLEQQKIKVVTIFSKDYPKQMLQAFQPPIALYCKGNLDLLHTFCLGVVGTRKPTAYGRMATEMFVRDLCKIDMTIVSGLAYGIDTVAHETTLAHKGKTIAVLGGGFHYIYPQSNIGLANKIAEEGLLLSQFPPSLSPSTFTFPKRNRTIALLSKGILVTEASLKSGSLHTKNFALDEGREVFALPGNILNDESKGCNEMIKNGHATMVLKPEDVASAFQRELKPIEIKKHAQLSFEENAIVCLLQSEEKEYENLIEETKLDAKTLNSALMALQIKNIIKKLPGNSYMLVR